MPDDLPHRSWPRRLAMTAVFAGNGIAFGAWAANLPRLRDQAHLNDASLGLVLLAVSCGAVMAMPLLGRYAARLGTGRTAQIAATLLLISLPLPALADRWALILAAALFLGFTIGSLDVAMNAHGAEMERRWGAAIMSSFHAGWSFGELLGAGAAGLLAAAAVPLWLSLALSGAAVAATGLAARAVPDTQRPRAAEASASFALPTRAMIGICTIAALSFSIEGGTADWCGVYLRTVLGASAALASTSLVAFAAVMASSRLFGDLVVHRLGTVRMLQLGALLVAAGLLAAITAPNLVLAALGFAVVGLGIANVVPILFSAAGRSGPAGVAMMATAGYGAVMGAPPLIGFAATAFGLRTAFGLLMAGAAVIALRAPSIADARAPTPV